MVRRQDMQRIVHEVLGDLALAYRVQNMFEPYRPMGMWGFTFVDPMTPGRRREFQIVVGPVNEAELDHTKAELAARLLEQQSTRDSSRRQREAGDELTAHPPDARQSSGR